MPIQSVIFTLDGSLGGRLGFVYHSMEKGKARIPNTASSPTLIDTHTWTTEDWPRRHRIAVGTVLADGPPHRSQRAGLPHWAPPSGTNVEPLDRVWMSRTGGRQPACSEPVHPPPVQPRPLTSPPQRPKPVPGSLGAERRDSVNISGHRVVGEVTADHTTQPLPLFRNG
jgi:hypothetical protein